MQPLISLKELAKLLGISVKTLKIRISKGTVPQPFVSEGKNMRWMRSDVEHLFSKEEVV
ncbi:hypothetical protein [Klebsiella phage phiKp_32]|nr:putative DNA-binding protein [Klebsiella phage KPN8]WNY41097.1 hypothetical protein [Klebsiella phage YC1]WPH68704.1 hypothetical protein [Stenotrophomonas phage BUCTxx100]BEH89808.1 hypothetical protein [Klebsiella phage phiKp_32]